MAQYLQNYDDYKAIASTKPSTNIDRITNDTSKDIASTNPSNYSEEHTSIEGATNPLISLGTSIVKSDNSLHSLKSTNATSKLEKMSAITIKNKNVIDEKATDCINKIPNLEGKTIPLSTASTNSDQLNVLPDSAVCCNKMDKLDEITIPLNATSIRSDINAISHVSTCSTNPADKIQGNNICDTNLAKGGWRTINKNEDKREFSI